MTLTGSAYLDSLIYRHALAGLSNVLGCGNVLTRSSVAVYVRETPRACVQLAGFGSGSRLRSWIQDSLGVCVPPNKSAPVLSGEAFLIAPAPATWMLVAEPGTLNGFIRKAELECTDIGVVTDFSDGRNVFIRIEGQHTALVLSKYADLDFNTESFTPGRCAATGMHHIPTTIVCHRADLYDVIVHRSLAVSLTEMLLDAATEFGVKLDRPDP